MNTRWTESKSSMTAPWKKSLCSSFCIVFFYCCGSGDVYVCVYVARQALYHSSHAPITFCFCYFSTKILHFCLELISDCDPPTPVSHVAGIAGVSHHAKLVLWGKILLILSPWLGLEPRSSYPNPKYLKL
jgi:hypothetical protein